MVAAGAVGTASALGVVQRVEASIDRSSMPSKTLFAALVVLLVGAPAPALAKPFFVEPDDGPDPRGLTLSGNGLARIEPPRRMGEDAIERAVGAVMPIAERRAMRDARRRAVAVARVAGLTLGRVGAVRTRVPDAELFGPHRHCHRAGDRARGLRCSVPPLATASIQVTFATDETSAVASTGRAIVASGSGSAPVRAQRRTSPAIRAALRRAQRVADPAALATALRNATGAARAAGLRRRALFSLAEEPRQPFSQAILSGTFGPDASAGPSGG